jgi:hypothetical protein
MVNRSALIRKARTEDLLVELALAGLANALFYLQIELFGHSVDLHAGSVRCEPHAVQSLGVVV